MRITRRNVRTNGQQHAGSVEAWKRFYAGQRAVPAQSWAWYVTVRSWSTIRNYIRSITLKRRELVSEVINCKRVY